MKTPEEIATLVQAGCHTAAMNAIRELYTAATSKWTPVKESLPAEDEWVMFFVIGHPSEDNRPHFGRRKQHFAWDSSEGRYETQYVSHWMPCPSDPEPIE